MFAHVKYLTDAKHENVPISFIKKFKEPLLKNKTYDVFWSPEENDTPETVLAKQGKVLHLDEELDLGKENKRKKPLAGYYKAKVLLTAGSEEELKFLLENKETRRTLCEQHNDSNNQASPKSKGKLSKNEKQKGKKRNVAKLMKNLQFHSFSDSSGEDDSIIPMSMLKEQTTMLKQELKEKDQQLKKEKFKSKLWKEKYNEVLQLNLELQKTLLHQSSSNLGNFSHHFPRPLSHIADPSSDPPAPSHHFTVPSSDLPGSSHHVTAPSSDVSVPSHHLTVPLSDLPGPSHRYTALLPDHPVPSHHLPEPSSDLTDPSHLVDPSADHLSSSSVCSNERILDDLVS